MSMKLPLTRWTALALFLSLSPSPTSAATAATAAPAAPSSWPIKDKTLVVWASPANLEQKGGSALTLEKAGAAFDGIVFGELTPATWMAGSDGFRRTKRQQAEFPKETTANGEPIQIAIVYQGRTITLYRDGQARASYISEGAESFPSNSWVLLGLRHLDAAVDHRFFVGSIEDARLYAVALTAEQMAALKPNEASNPAPLAWWDFENGSATDRMKTFSTSALVGDARVANGRLHLDRAGAYLMATRVPPGRDREPSSLAEANRSARALREKLASDPLRPGYHFVIPEGTGMPFDPNGAIFWKGRYHLFYIYQDKGDHHWGHVSSTDLFHWRHHPTGLLSGMFSGNCFLDERGRPTMCYHQVGQGNAMAVALDDELNEWKKLPSNPITPKTQLGDPHHGKYRSWDPFGWREGNTYYAIFGGEHAGLAKAPALEGEWKYVGDFLANTVPGVSINEDISCADFFKLGDRHMLLCISHRLGARYYLGEWKGEQFHPTFHEKMSWVDNSYFAPESLVDDRGRRIMWAWLMDLPQFKMHADNGWSGTMSLPRVLNLTPQGTLRMNPPAEIERLRYNAKTKSNLEIRADGDLALADIRGTSLELNIQMSAADAKQYGVKVCASPGGEEETLVYYDATEKKLKIDTMKSGLSNSPKTIEGGPCELQGGEPLQLRIFVDKSVIEVFANDGRQAIMRRVYPTRSDSTGVALFSKGGPATVRRLEAWEMMPSNPH
jgi:sucrose-6-phosphate hydrolase SacC (GH32 family)